MAKILGIDYGLERIGLAITDPEGKIPFPLATLCMSNFPNRGAILDALAEIAIEQKAEVIVLGLPLFPDGSENSMTAIVRNVSQRIKRRLPLPLYFMPEAFSSVEANSRLADAKLKVRKRKAALDQQAACEIVASFIAGGSSV